MYLPPAFSETRTDVLHAAIRTYPLGTLVTAGARGIETNQAPFLLVEDEEGGTRLKAHLARANPQLDALREGAEAVVLFHGPQAYVSPSWYPTKQEHGKVVPTWNYVVVEARGAPVLHDDANWLHDQIEALTQTHESAMAEPWSVDDAPADFISSMLRLVVGVEIEVSRLEGKWKASQNQPAGNRAGVIDGLRSDDPQSAMVELMAGLQAED